MYMILNFAVGGWPGDPPSWPEEGDTFEIDWVRVWKPREPDAFIDLGNIVGGGDGRPGSPAPHVGLHPATGACSDDLGLDGVAPAGANPQPVSSSLVDSVFLILDDRGAVNTAGTRFAFPAGDSSDGTWDLIANVVEPDGPPGVLRLGSGVVCTRGIGIHAASGITFDLDGLRRRYGDRQVMFFSALAGEGSIQSGGRVNNHVILADGDGRLLHSRSTGPHQDDGRFLEVELPRNARFLTLATGSAGDGNGQDHGIFGNAFVTPCSVGDPDLCPPLSDEILSFSGSSWYYLDRGEAPAGDWTGRSFSMADWKRGLAQLGYGEGDESTEIAFGGDPDRKYITTYFRRLFTVREAAGITGLSLWLLRDDGALVYLNGSEVLRSNLPPGSLNADILASDTVDGDEEGKWIVADVDPCLLVEGVNVLAVEVHQASRTSSDVSFDLVLAARRDPDAIHPCRETFLRGDSTADGGLDLADVVRILTFLFIGGVSLDCLDAADVDDSGELDLADAIKSLNYQFVGTGGPPGPPGPFQCGPDPTPDELTCKEFSPCR